MDGMTFLFIGLGLLSLLGLFMSHRANRHRRLLSALPTSQVQGVFIGLVELKGTAESEAPRIAFLSGKKCVLYSWNISESWQREVEETYTDEDGKTQRRTRTDSGSTTIASGGQADPFYLKDETGVILVNPEGADVHPADLFSRTCGKGDSLYFGKGPSSEVSGSTHSRSFNETGILLHSDVYLVGRARERADIVAPEIAKEKGSPVFLISTHSEEKVLKGYGIALWVWGIFGLLPAIGIGCLRVEKWAAVALLAGIYTGAWCLTWIWMVYNSLVDTRNRVRQGWSQLDVQLKRRHDLIPQLVACVEALRSHEMDVQTAVAAMRTQESATPPGKSGPDFHGIARTVIVLGENYPVLKTDGAFLNLQKQIIETEQRIALARAYFNDIATAYNTRLEAFPDSVIGFLTRFKQRPLLTAEDFERAAVTVKLAE